MMFTARSRFPRGNPALPQSLGRVRVNDGQDLCTFSRSHIDPVLALRRGGEQRGGRFVVVGMNELASMAMARLLPRRHPPEADQSRATKSLDGVVVTPALL